MMPENTPMVCTYGVGWLEGHLTGIQAGVDAVVVVADSPPPDGRIEIRSRSPRRVDAVDGFEQPVHDDSAVVLYVPPHRITSYHITENNYSMICDIKIEFIRHFCFI